MTTGAGKPVLFLDREAGKAGISTFEILKNFFNCFWSGLRYSFLVPLNNVLLISYRPFSYLCYDAMGISETFLQSCKMNQNNT